MTETDDDVLDVLRRARPDDLPAEETSPHSADAQALLADVLGRPRAHPVTRRRRKHRKLVAARLDAPRRSVLVATAAAVLATVSIGALFTPGPSEPSAAATLDAALAQTSELIELSGRAVQTNHLGPADEPPDDPLIHEYEFSGDDGSVSDPLGRIFRVVDGVGYSYGPVPPDDRWEWRRLVGLVHFTERYPDGASGAFSHDPRTLLGTLSTAGDFEQVDTEEVDGLRTRRLRATDPDRAIDVGQLSQGIEGHASSLEVWVDGDDIVRRIDFRIDDADGLDGVVWSSSLRFFDLGEPIVIEAPGDVPLEGPPPDIEDISPEDLVKMQNWMLAAARCMRDRGYDHPDPQFGDKGWPVVADEPVVSADQADQFVEDRYDCWGEPTGGDQGSASRDGSEER